MCKKIERNFQKKYIFVTAMKNIVSYISGVLLVVMLSVSVAYAQNSMCFRQTTWNFGDIAEDGGKVTHTFTFVNNTNEPISILRVTATCGCTTPEYSKQPIMPGKQGAIDVTYDPMDRPGRFEKKVVVKNSLQQDIALVVEGRVIPRQKSVEELYRNCQYVSLHIPATAETKNSINYSLTSIMPKGAMLVNTARKEVGCEADLVRIMEERADFRYVTDIMPAANAEFAEKFPGRYFSTPKKMGAQTAEANINAGIAAAHQTIGFLRDGIEKFRVNK